MTSKTATTAFGTAFILLPLAIWFALYAAVRLWGWNLRPTLRWIRVLRWAGWGMGVAFYFVYLANNRFAWATVGIASFSFGLGLSMPEAWVKRRFAPELIEPDQPNEWWLSQRD